MAQIGFFDYDRRLELLSKKGDRLEAIDKLVRWESFRPYISWPNVTPPRWPVFTPPLTRVNAGVNLHRLAGAKVQQGCKR